MNLDITIVNFLTVWVNEHPHLTLFSILTSVAFIASISTLNIMYELTDKSNLNKKMRFGKLFCGWTYLAILTMYGPYLSSEPQESPVVIPSIPGTISTNAATRSLSFLRGKS